MIFEVLKNLSNQDRIKILKILSQKSPRTFTEIMNQLKMDPGSDAGRFGYHLRNLKETGLISGGKDDGYDLTKVGEKIVEFIWDLGDLVRTEMSGTIYVRTSEYSIESFDRKKISESLVKEANVPNDLAEEIAKEAEERLVQSKIRYLSAPLIREFVNFILLEKGLENYRHALTRLGLPPFDVKSLIKSQSSSSNPSIIQRIAGDAILEQYLILNVLDHQIGDLYLSGEIFIPNANLFILRPNSIQHDLRVFLDIGLPNLGPSISLSPPKNFRSVLSIISKIFDISNCSREQSFDHFNVFLAPYIKNLEDEEIKSELRLFFECLGYDFEGFGKNINFEFSVPSYLESAPVTLPRGKIGGTYADYQDETERLLSLVLDVLLEGAPYNQPFLSPHHFFKIRSDTLSKAPDALLNKLVELIAKFGTPFIINLSKTPNILNFNMTGSLDALLNDFKEVEVDTMRTGNMDWIVVNLMRIAYDADGDEDRFFEMLEGKLKIAMQALLQKKEQMEIRLLTDKLLPLLSFPYRGENYFRHENATYSISYIGLPNAVKMRILQTMESFVRQARSTSGLRVCLKQSSSNGWNAKLAKLDRKKNTVQKIKVPKKFEFEKYSSSNYNERLSPEKIIEYESILQPMLNGGSFALFRLSQQDITFDKVKQLLLSASKSTIRGFGFGFPYTYCSSCQKILPRSISKCTTCGASGSNLLLYNRDVGPYFVRIS
ncbi:MAG: anaerobic ribonucleoside-triphosphate reductase [Candidatus Helarchaeota archaeon]